MGRLTCKSFISKVIVLICSLICILFSSSAISCEFFILYVCGKQSKLCRLLFKCFAVLYDGACVLFITGLIGLLSLCVLMCILSFGAIGFMFVRYLYVFLSTSNFHLWIVCWICLWYLSVRSLVICFMLFSCIKFSTFFPRVFLLIITIALLCFCQLLLLSNYYFGVSFSVCLYCIDIFYVVYYIYWSS